MLKLKQSGDQINLAIVLGEPFRASAMRGQTWFTGINAISSGTESKLPTEWETVFRYEGPNYVVWSYETPIAWWVPPKYRTYGKWNDRTQRWETSIYVHAHWTVPPIVYSHTTTRHQKIVTAALGLSLVRTDPAFSWDLTHCKE